MKVLYRCKKCKEQLNHHIFIGLCMMFGATSSVKPTECSEGGEHEYEEAK